MTAFAAIPIRLASRCVVLLACATLVAAGEPTERKPSRRPNVVFLLADQWRAAATGFAGDPNVKTPHLDRLAAEGVRFDNAVSVCPVCTPYRATLLTGCYPLTHGLFLNDVPLRNDRATMAEVFARAGYQTAYIGKWHLDGHGRSSFIPPERRHGFQFWRAAECTHNYNRSLYYADDDARLYWQGYDAAAQTAEACRYIAAERDKRFLLVVSWGPPHNPYDTAPERFRRAVDPQQIVLRKNVPKQSEQAARRDLAGYYAHCSALDECLGQVVRTLADCGLEDDTILVFTSDHGDMLGSHGQVRKQRPWDESIRVPLVIRWPAGLGRAARKLILPINSPDLLPTLLGLCGVAVPTSVEGTDYARLVRGLAPDRDEAALILCASPFGEWTREQGGREYRGVRTARYTYVRTLDGPWLLYDNQQDPLQLENLCNRPDHAPLQAEMEARLKEKLQATRDEFRPGSDYVRQWGYETDLRGTVPYAP